MLAMQYDGSFAGFLCCIFEAFERKAFDCVISARQQSLLFGSMLEIPADETKAKRVWTGLQKRLPADGLHNFYSCFLSEEENIEYVLLQYCRHIFSRPQGAEQDFGNQYVLHVAQLARKVWREKHRMEAFVRFEQMKDGLYYAAIDPDHDVLPLIAAHFKSRYASQDWLIYDTRRKYGLHYTCAESLLHQVEMDWAEDMTATNVALAFDEKEPMYQQLWKDYFKSTGIAARSNMKLHLKHIPRRYWKYLTEKK